MPPPMRLYALRGATTVTANDRDAILAATDELMRTILDRNALAADDLVAASSRSPRTSTPSSRPSPRARWG